MREFNHMTVKCLLVAFLLLIEQQTLKPAIHGVPATSDDVGLTVIPRLEKCELRSGAFAIAPSTQIFVVAETRQVPFPVEQFVRQLRSATGFPLKVSMNARAPQDHGIVFEYTRDNELGAEGYTLDVTRENLHVRANADAGQLYAVQTLFQLLPESVFGVKPAPDIRWTIPCLRVQDRPRFPWRGMHLDVSRHFLPKEFIKNLLDLLATHKMNTFHWHLTDDQGWRIEIKKYPRLTQVGAWRADREGIHWNLREPQRAGEQATYGGYYTQAEIREIVQYARQRNITILPEIEMPAHTTAALAAYPQFSCTGGPFLVTTGALWPISDIFCAGNDSTFAFLQDVLSEVFDLFPGTYVHIGGDEADKSNWKKCPKCQTRMKQAGLTDENQLQSYFIKRIEKFVLSKNRRLIGWDEILDGGLAPEATVMSWRGMEGGLAAARQGHDVVMTPGSHCYFNSYQGRPEFEPPAGGGYLTLGKVYSFEPVPDSLTVQQAAHILGGQACLWTEFIADPPQAEYMILPRLAAMAEVLWSPKDRRDQEHFFSRIESQLHRYQAAGYTYAKSLYSVSMSSVLDTVRRQVRVSLANESGNAPIRYTLDGNTPTVKSLKYTGPFVAERSLEIQAVSVRNDQLLSAPTTHHITLHKAVARPVTAKFPYHKYTGGDAFALTNGMLGTKSYDDGNWQGYEQNDLDATIDLGNVTTVSRVTAHFLQDHHSWIFGPTVVQYEVSEDGKRFSSVGTFEVPIPTAAQEVSILKISQELPAVKARFIRVFAKNLGVCPAWHAGRGGKAWLFVDEIIVE
jgi:hexosaminidase